MTGGEGLAVLHCVGCTCSKTADGGGRKEKVEARLYPGTEDVAKDVDTSGKQDLFFV